MAKTLVIVESPAKAQTIKRFLGKGYDVHASYGHVRDLPSDGSEVPKEIKDKKWGRMAVDVENDFEPYYVVSKEKKRHVTSLKQAAKGAETILLATDEDREGESISWHVLQVLKPKKSVEVKRIVFHEITQEAIEAAISSPRDVDENVVKAQETRRILDRLYGYTLSPLLWRKVAGGLSAGRVQSVAVRLVVLKEKERRDFVIAKYGAIEAELGAGKSSFRARLDKIDDKSVATGGSFGQDGQLQKDHEWLRMADASSLADTLKASDPWTVTGHETKPGKENPPPPFMTSTLQQEANRKFGYPARRTMQIAQTLYEGVDLGGGEREGLITYMRTDSLSLAGRALEQIRGHVSKEYGPDYIPAKARVFKSKTKGAQEAHEAIRPTDVRRTPDALKGVLSAEQMKVYELIWKRTLACQMKPAEVERTRVEVTVQAEGRSCAFAASGKSITFPGFLRVYVEGADDPEAELGDKETILPAMKKGDTLDARDVEADEKATRPPARYTEATLVKTLETEGIGRPSTYATIMGTIQDRGYVRKQKQELIPTFTAFAVTDLLEGAFRDLVDTTFTAKMEEQLDDIAEGELDPIKHLRNFYEGNGVPGIRPQVEEKGQDIPFPALEIGEGIILKIGRSGPYISRGEGDERQTASVPEDIAPADLTLEKAQDLLATAEKGDEPVATDPETGAQVFLKTGRYGAYFERELQEGEDKPKRVSVPPKTEASDLTEEDIAALLSFPRNMGEHPETGEPVMLNLGRYGAYLTSGKTNANVGDWKESLDLTLEAAVAKLAEKKGQGRGQREPIKTFGTIEGVEGEVKLMDGRYGPYVTNGEVNATVPKGTEPDAVDAEKAKDLILAKIAAGPTKKRRRRKK